MVEVGSASNGIDVQASGVTLSGMTVQNASQAVDVNGQDGNLLSDFAGTDLVTGEKVSDRALAVDDSDDVVLKDIVSNDNGNDGVTIWYTNDVRMEHITANDNGDNGVYWNGDDLGPDTQRTVIDTVVAMDNGEDDVELHDNGGDNATADDSKLLKHAETGGAPTGLRLVDVSEDEVQTVASSFPNGILDGNDNDVDP